MLFGDLSTFAVEAVPEPDPELPRLVGRSLAGRLQVHLGGQAIGNFAEPSCAFGPLAEHLTTLCASSELLWHESLEGLDTPAIFQKLDRACFRGQEEPYPSAFDLMGFLTNVSECFNNIKGFVGAPSPGVLKAILQLQPSGILAAHEIAVAQWSSAAASFAVWLTNQEGTHGASEA
jgi:hypothetical protein